MASQKRRPDTSVVHRLYEEYYSFSFYQAVALLETLHPGKKRIGQSLEPDKEAVRFTVKPGLVFPPSDIEGLSPGDEETPVNMSVTFMGLIGPAGLLPHWYNEHAIERRREKDFALIDFLDIFHHRLVSLFYLAWKKNQFPVNYLPGAKDKLSGYLLSLAGLGTPGLAGRIGLTEESLSFYSGLLSRQVPSAVAIQATVEHFADTNVSIDQFVERLVPLNPEDQTQIGKANGRLGEETVCGSFVRECQTKFLVNLGPMPYADFSRFLPSGDMLYPIFSLVRYLVGVEYEFEIRIFLQRQEVPTCILGDQQQSARLGWSTWMKSPDFMHEKDPFISFQEMDILLN